MSNAEPPLSCADNVPLAVGAIIVTVLALSLSDALVKMTSSSFVIWQIFVIRSLIVIPILLVFLAVRAPAKLRTPQVVTWVILRSLMLVGMWIFYYISLPKLALSAAAAASPQHVADAVPMPARSCLLAGAGPPLWALLCARPRQQVDRNFLHIERRAADRASVFRTALGI